MARYPASDIKPLATVWCRWPSSSTLTRPVNYELRSVKLPSPQATGTVALSALPEQAVVMWDLDTVADLLAAAPALALGRPVIRRCGKPWGQACPNIPFTK